jgi:pyruvate/2-oxoacid:ferredoxin oxidoreductase beta subunit
METQKFTSALLYIGIFAGIPLAVIAALFSLALPVVDPDAMLILIIFTAMFVAMWIFVPSESPVRPRRAAEAREAAVKRAVPAPRAPEKLTDKAKKRKARSRRTLFEEDQKREPFVDAVEKSTRHPAAQPQVRRKAQSKARKKKKKR